MPSLEDNIFRKPCVNLGGHCYHPTGIVRVTDPPQFEEKCCWCGQIRFKMDESRIVPKGHGPHYPK